MAHKDVAPNTKGESPRHSRRDWKKNGIERERKKKKPMFQPPQTEWMKAVAVTYQAKTFSSCFFFWGFLFCTFLFCTWVVWFLLMRIEKKKSLIVCFQLECARQTRPLAWLWDLNPCDFWAMLRTGFLFLEEKKKYPWKVQEQCTDFFFF